MTKHHISIESGHRKTLRTLPRPRKGWINDKPLAIAEGDTVIVDTGAAPEPAPEPMLYVSPAGSDTNNGSEEHPLKTPQKAIDLSQGESVYLMSGLFPGADVAKDVRILGVGTLDGSLNGRKSVLAIASGSVTVENIGIARAIGPSGGGTDGPALIRVTGGHARILGTRMSDAGTGTFPFSSNTKGKCSPLCRQGGFGILAKGGTLDALGNEISGGVATGIRAIGKVSGNIKRNRIKADRLFNHGQWDSGAQGIAVRDKPAGSGMLYIEENYLHDSIAHSPEFGGDGGAIELYNWADVVIRRNRAKDTRNFSEMGGNSGWSSQIGNGLIEFNEFWRTAAGAQGCENAAGIAPSFFHRMVGINFRNGVNVTCQHNSAYLLNLWGMFEFSNSTGGFGGTIAGGKVLSNALFNGSRLYEVKSIPEDFVIDYNAHNPEKAWANGHSSLASWQSATRHDDHAIEASPLFTRLGDDPDFMLQSGSSLIGKAHDGGNIGAR